jgi:hypothetical protein
LSPFITVVTVAAAALPANVNVAVTAATASQRFFITLLSGRSDATKLL